MARQRPNDNWSVSSLVWAESDDGFHFKLADRPAFDPDENSPYQGGFEDPRLVEIDGKYILTFTGVKDVGHTPGMMAISDDLEHWDVLGEVLPARLAQAVAADAVGEAPRPMADLPDKLLRGVAERIKRRRVVPAGTEGYAKAEVMAGGIDTAALSSQTMGARDVPGLFAIGEAVDVTGWLGGYNFQWAWSSGWCAGQAV